MIPIALSENIRKCGASQVQMQSEALLIIEEHSESMWALSNPAFYSFLESA